MNGPGRGIAVTAGTGAKAAVGGAAVGVASSPAANMANRLGKFTLPRPVTGSHPKAYEDVSENDYYMSFQACSAQRWYLWWR